MGYTIKQASEMTGLSIDTLRYYDKEGLLPNLKRRESGYRIFHEMDLETIRTIECFKQAGMQIKDIKRYMYLFLEGESTLQERYEILIEQKRNLEEKRTEIDAALHQLKKKIAYHEEVMKTGSEKAIRDKVKELQRKKDMDE